MKKELEKDPVLSYNLYWIKPGTLKDVKLPKQGLFAVTNIESAQYNDGPYVIPWDGIWSKKRQKIQFYLDEKSHEHPPNRANAFKLSALAQDTDYPIQPSFAWI
ncbi:MAG: hypothetical protein GQ574_11995 [Crocinitomix sp.]|nr:hypothetical protein [Crocinitomix sp.]